MSSVTANLTRGDNMKNMYGGSFVDWQWIRMRYSVTAASSDVFNSVRIILGQWRGTLTAPQAGFVLDFAEAIDPVVAPYSMQNRPLYTILSDTVVTVDIASNNQVVKSIFVPGSKIRRTEFQRTTDSAISGDLFVVIVSNSALIPNPDVEVSIEGMFTDDI